MQLSKQLLFEILDILVASFTKNEKPKDLIIRENSTDAGSDVSIFMLKSP